jgi:hypothetical protein
VGQYTQGEANQLIEEFMLLANMRVAQMIAAGLPERSLLRWVVMRDARGSLTHVCSVWYTHILSLAGGQFWN